jgi:hypothetical protein
MVIGVHVYGLRLACSFSNYRKVLFWNKTPGFLFQNNTFQNDMMDFRNWTLWDTVQVPFGLRHLKEDSDLR